MKIFVCSICENSVCTCSFKGNGKPFICPKGHNQVKWDEVKKTATTTTDIAKESE